MERLRDVGLAVLLAASPAAGCVERVVVGGEGGQGGEGQVGFGISTAAAWTSTGGVDFDPKASLRARDAAVEAEICALTSPCDVPDDAFVLVIDSAEPICGLPLQRTYPTGSGWRLVVVIPADKLAVGVYPLAEHPDIYVASYGLEETSNGTNGVTVGGVSAGAGAIEITAVNGLAVTLRTTGLSSSYFDSDGEYTTTACE